MRGDLNIVRNIKLRDLLSKGPKYREPVSYSWHQNFDIIMDACEEYARRWAKKEDVEVDTLSEWIKSIADVLKRRIRRLKHSVNTRHESIFSDPDVIILELANRNGQFVFAIWRICPNNTNILEDVEIWFTVKFPAGNAYPSGHLVPSPILGLANAPIVETKFLELAMSLLDFSPRIPLGTFSILLLTTTHVPLQVDNLSPRVLVG